MSPITIDSIKTWIKNTEQHHWKEMGEASDSQSLDWTCPKDIFKLDDFFIESIFKLGQEFFYKNELHLALSVLTVLVFLNPISPHAQLLLGLTFINLGRKEEAEQALGTALFLAPSDLSIIYYVGRYYFSNGDKATAVKFFEIILDSKDATPDMKHQCRKLINRGL